MSNNDVILLYFQQNCNGDECPPCPPWPPWPPRSIASKSGNGEVEKDGTINTDDNSNPVAPPKQRMTPIQHSIATSERILKTDERSTRARVSNTIYLLSHCSKPYDYIIRASFPSVIQLFFIMCSSSSQTSNHYLFLCREFFIRAVTEWADKRISPLATRAPNLV